MFKNYNPACFILCLALGVLQQGCDSNSPVKQKEMNIVGNWAKHKGNACSEKYPDKIEFKQNGIYQAESDTSAAVHPVWDAGTFEFNAGSINISTANDAIIKYAIAMDNKTITFTDPEGCIVIYKRL